MKKKKRKRCNNLTYNFGKCPCPEDCPRKGFCCECIEFHAALGEVPFCLADIAKTGAVCSAGGATGCRSASVELELAAEPEKPAKPVGPVTKDTPGFRLTDFASCPG